MINVSAATKKVKLSKPKITVTVNYKKIIINSDLTMYTPKATIKIQKVKNAKKYQIYMKIKDSKWTLIKTTTSKSYTKGLANSNTYYFKVKAVNNRNYSKFSNTKKIKTKQAISTNHSISTNVSKTELNLFKSRYNTEKNLYLNNINTQIKDYNTKINSLDAPISQATTKHYTTLANLRNQYASAGLLNSGAYQTAVNNENLRYNQEINYYNNQKTAYRNKISELQKLKAEEYIKEYAFEQINQKYGTSYEDMNIYYNQLY